MARPAPLWLALPTVLLLLGAPASTAEKDLVADGGFEKGIQSWEVRDVSGAFEVEHDRQVRTKGKASAHLRKSGGPRALRADGFALAIPKVPAGVTVTVSAQVRGQDLQNAWLKLMVYDESATQLLDEVAVHDENLRGTFDWRRVEREFAIPEEATRAELVLFLYLDGEAWLDEVSVLPHGKGKTAKEKNPEPLDAATRRWLEEHAVKVKHTRLRGGMEDLAPLAEVLRDVRIVQLGENTHRDGACFEAKARLIRFFHEELGFEVLAFESGLYECDRANALLVRGQGGEAMRGSIFGIWWSGIVENLFDYLAERARGEKPLVLAGFDCRGSGNLRHEMLGRLAEFLEPAGPPAAQDVEALRTLEKAMEAMGDEYEPTSQDLEAGRAAWERIRAGFDAGRDGLVAKHGAEETEFFSRVLDNWRRREEFERSKTDSSLGKHGSGNLRDEAMADNLRWLAEVRYPGKKIITWGATFHLAHGLAGVRVDGDPNAYEGCRNMGQGTFETFGALACTVGFAAFGGKAGAFGSTFDLARPRKDSVEDVLHRYGAPLLFVDLRPPEGPFRRTLRMAPLGYSRDIEAAWPTVLDAVFYVEEMTPVR